MRRIKNPKPNEYVLITKYSDHDPNDPWALGWFTRKNNWKGTSTYYIKDENGNESSYPKYKNCFRLTLDEGKDWMSLYGPQSFIDPDFRVVRFVGTNEKDYTIEDLG